MHQPPVRFTYRLLSYLISTIIAGQPLLPAVGAVITPQNGAGMDKAANGVPVVNIATPNGAGISHNRFTDYNVGKEGLILNNATGKLNPTQLGGLIQNNPNLKAGGEAKGIINEVTGGNRSLLQGYTEVAGKAANVMVANPYGITCDGCGFINTPHATLTTGKPVMNADGSLQALEVTEGSITINGAGLDGTRSDAVSIIARATEVNAALHAKDLTVTAGANRITADGRVSALKGEGDVPKVAVDTGALGGMYARRIHLTSTESGVGVNLGNLYAREGDIILNSAGKLVLKNSLAGGNTTVTGTNVSLSGDNKAGGNLSVTGTTGLTLNQSRLVTDKNLVLSSSGQIVQNGGELTAGQNAMLSAQHLNQTSGTVNAAENVTLTTTDDTTLKGRSVAGKTLTVSSGSLNNGGTLVAGRDATVKTGTFSNTGAVQGNGLKVTATDLTSTGSIKSGSTLDISVRNATLSGDAGAKDSARVTVSGTLENRGRLVSDDVLTLSATQINNSGTLSGAKELVVSADTLTTTEKSVTNSDGNLMLNSASSTLAGETSAGGTVSVKGNSLKTTTTAQTQGNSVSVDVQNAQLDGTQAARDILTLNASEKLTHSGKSSAPSLSLSAPELTSSGVLVASALNTQSQTLTNSGLLQGEASLTVNTQRLDNQQNGTLYSAADLTLDIPDIRNSGLITGDTGSDMQRGIQAATAALQGNSAAAGAIGAGTGEVIASAIAKSLYPGVDPSKLTEDQKQTVSTLATLSAGMAGGIASGDVAGAAAGAGAGKNVVENNALSLVARGCAVAAPCRTKVAEQLLEIGAKAGMAGLAGAAVKDMADRMTSDELEHLITLQMMGNDEITTKYLSSLHDKYGSGAASNPNIGKDLTDAEKVELGGSGSGTGTPPPSENDPKQQNEKTVDKLNQKQESAIKKIDNTIKNALKDHDIIGTLKDMDGKPVPKENGGYWDHMQEMQNTLRGLRNHADTLKNVNNPEAQAAYGRATDAINKIESALKGYGI